MVTPLASLAELSGGFVISATFTLFIFMVIYILSTRGPEESPFVDYYPIHEVALKPFDLPFSLSVKPIKEDVSSDLHTEPFSLEVKWRADCSLHLFWNVAVSRLDEQLKSPWLQFACWCKTSNETHVLKCENSDGFQLSTFRLTAPARESYATDLRRSSYPLVAVILSTEGVSGLEKRLGAAAYIIHVQDKACSLPTAIMWTYVKAYSGEAHRLQPVFASSEDEEDRSPVCVVCATNRATHVVLPCRHACLCEECFPRLRDCPVCRAPIRTYFRSNSNNTTEFSSFREHDSDH